MKIIIVHYHLLPGGVTRIIGSQVKALLETDCPPEVTVVCGPGGLTEIAGAAFCTEDLLGYRTYDTPGSLQEASRALADKLGGMAGNAILHIHNAGLGKNPALTLAVHRLVDAGFRVVNHCHDFPEDRPANYAELGKAAAAEGLSVSELLYPDRTNCHFAVLNGCDHRRLLSEGLPPARVHLLPNPVALAEAGIHPDGEQRKRLCRTLELDPACRLVTYPVRAIGRKNLGELILLAILFRDTTCVVVTQPPKNPAEGPAYAGWKHWCLDHGVKVTFEAGEKINHEELIGISEFCITTSVREGFGMVFIEPWLAGTPVVGRDLPCVTADLKNAGMELPGLYDSLYVDGPSGVADFGTLEDEGKKGVLERLLKVSGERERIFTLNPFLEDLFKPQDQLVEKNRACIRQHYSLARYGEKLSAIYQALS